MTNINSNVDEILTQLNKEKTLILKYDIGFQNNNLSSIDSSKNENFLKNKKEERNKFSCFKTLMGHTNKIVSLIELESGKLVSGSYDNTIRIWDINDKSGNEQVINESERILSLLEFEKNKILSGTGDNSINLWDLENPEEVIFSFKGHELWVNALVKCDSNFFASASNDSKIKIWDYFKRECVSTLKGHVDCILSLILLKNKNLCSGSADLTIRIWDWGLGECVSILKGHTRWVKCVLELDNGILVTGSDDKTIKLWKNEVNFKTLEEHAHSVRTFCQINERLFASGSFNYTIKI
jgi:WD40 repeat protein